MFKKWLSLLVLIGLVLGVAACAPTAATPATPTKAAATTTTAATPTAATKAATTAPASTPVAKTTLKFGAIPVLTNVGVWVAIDKGYFAEQGIDMELVTSSTTSELLAPLGTGGLDVASLTMAAGLLSAADRGVDLKIVGDMGRSQPKWEFTWFLLRKDLADSGKIKTPADLKGSKVSITSVGSTADLAGQLLIAKGGLKPEDVQTEVVLSADTAVALANKAIDVAYVIEPNVAQVVQQGIAVKWTPISSLFGGTIQHPTVVYGQRLIKDQDLGRRFMVAYLKGVRDYMKAFTTGEGRDSVIKSMTTYSAIKDPKLYDVMEMSYVDPNGMPDMNSLETEAKFFSDKGLYTGKKTVKDLTDFSYLDFAVQKLGKQ